jgi:hypothetical protein
MANEYKLSFTAEQVNTKLGKIDSLAEKTELPTKISELAEDSSHRVVTDTEKAAWNAKSNFSGSYNDLADKPEILSVETVKAEIKSYVDEAILGGAW